jgi:hypothetical protein
MGTNSQVDPVLQAKLEKALALSTAIVNAAYHINNLATALGTFTKLPRICKAARRRRARTDVMLRMGVAINAMQVKLIISQPICKFPPGGSAIVGEAAPKYTNL